MDDRTVIALGAGAAGIFAAIAAADRGARVTVLERSARPLAKVLVSGGGRCNVTHACFDPERLVAFYPRGGDALRGAFSRFQPQHTIEWFRQRGVELKTEADGRMFPTTDRSATIADCLLQEASRLGVELRFNALVESLVPPAGPDARWKVVFASGECVESDAVIAATGSSPQAWDWMRALGHTIEEPVPSLFTFTIADPRLQGLAGVSVPQARVQLEGTPLVQRGPLLITHWGLSGPAVLKLSAWGARDFYARRYEATIRVHWLADGTVEELIERLRSVRKAQPKRSAAATKAVDLPQRLWERLLAATGLAPAARWADLSNAHLSTLASQIADARFQMTAKSAFKDEFVTCGGVRRDEIDFRTMESKKRPGLYVVGEALDVDGVTGGFNFQNAWTTGWIAGRSAGSARS